MKKYLLPVLLFSFMGGIQSSGNNKAKLCDEDLVLLLQSIQDFSENNETVVSHVQELNDKYASKRSISYNYFTRYIELLSSLLVDLIELSSPDNIKLSNKLFIDVSNRLVSDLCIYSASFSLSEQKKILSPVYKILFDYTERSFLACMDNHPIITQENWEDAVPCFNFHVRVCSDVFHVLQIIDRFSYLYNHYCRQELSENRFKEKWNEFMNSGSHDIELIVSSELSDLNIFFNRYDVLLSYMISWPFYSYTTRIILPMLKLIKKDLDILKIVVNKQSLLNHIEKFKQTVLVAAKEKLDKAAEVIGDIHDTNTYHYVAKCTAHELALDQVRVLSIEFDNIFSIND